MDTDSDRADPELGPSRPSLHLRSFSDMAGFGGSTIAGNVSSPQPMYSAKSPIDEKVFQDDGTRQTFDRGIRGPHRRDTSLSGQVPYGDPSSKIWGLYLSQAERVDKEHTDSWTANTDGVLVFTGLFSAVVAAFIVVSYPLLQPSPADITNQLLSQISQQLSSNGTGSSQPSSPPNRSSFKPSASALRVNTLWFTSLAFSTACALWATLMQQWTRRYVQVADRPYALPKRAQIRAFFSDGVDKFALGAAVEVLPALLHTSVLLFYVGLIDFLLNINHTVAFTLLAWVAIGVLTYFVLSMMPLFYPNSPYQTPLSSLCWFVMEAAPFFWLWLRRRDTHRRRAKIGHGMRKALESKATGPDANALRWTLKSLDEDHKLEEFLDGIPGLFENQEYARRHPARFREELEKSVKPVADKLFTTCTPAGLLPEMLRMQRLTSCLRAIWCFPGTIDRHYRAIWKQWDKVTNDHWGPLSTETWAVALNMTELDRLNLSELGFITALRAHYIQALMAVMWRKEKWQCPPPEAAEILERQLGASFVDIDRWHTSGGDQLQLAVAANLLSNSLPLLHELEKLGTGADTTLKADLSAILDKMCDRLDASDVPHELRARLAEVMKTFLRTTLDLDGSWRKVLIPIA